MKNLAFIIFLFWAFIACSTDKGSKLFTGQGSLAGEISDKSVILQSRLTQTDSLVDSDLPGVSGFANFELSKSEDFNPSFTTSWIEALPENDFIIKTVRSNLFWFLQLVFLIVPNPY